MPEPNEEPIDNNGRDIENINIQRALEEFYTINNNYYNHDNLNLEEIRPERDRAIDIDPYIFQNDPLPNRRIIRNTERRIWGNIPPILDNNLDPVIYNAGVDLNNENEREYILPKKLNEENRKVKLAETGIEVNREDTVYISVLGAYFLKIDTRVEPDILEPDAFIINDPKYINRFLRIIESIDNDGNLIGNKYTSYRNSYYGIGAIPYERINLPIIFISLKEHVLIRLELLNSTIFNYKYKECLRDGVFYPKDHPSILKEFVKSKRLLYRKRKCGFNRFIESIKNKPNTFLQTYGMRYSWGSEIETISGFIPEYLDNVLFYSAVHDGSLRDEETGETNGGEYVTSILQGDLGLKQLKRLTYELSRRCLVDKKCSVHNHISGPIFNKENIILMYYIYQNIQSEIFDMMPTSRRNNVYCRFLPHVDINIEDLKKDRKYYIDKYYDDIMIQLSQKDTSGAYINKKKDHPKGHKCGYDHSALRYCWVNFIPAVFDTRLNGIYTIEFRAMSGTTSYSKIKNWLLICFALVNIVDNHKREIYDNSSLNLNNIIKICYPKNYTEIIDFIETRKKKFLNTDNKLVEMEDHLDNEINNDFTQKGI